MTAASLQGAVLGTWGREPGTLTGRTMPLPEGVSLPFVIASEAHVLNSATEWDPHVHSVHELVWVRDGTMTARVGRRVFTVAEGYGLWVPAGEVHAGRLTAKIRLYDAFFAPERIPRAFEGPAVVEMTPVLESLLIHLSRSDLSPGERARAEAVVFDVLEPSQRQLAVQLPNDVKINPIAEAILTNPGDERSLDEWARELRTSTRTITRAFRAATGLTFSQWRQSARIHRALTLLADGVEVQDVSEMLGYAHPGTFIDAFRRVMGTTPGSFVNAS
ncbi:helix-turn-helix domain-containing protein [Rhodococcus artemisiae]|uniref:AraC family transcriptional regulator n=1 Tax=Rhodococcus artemisiae TaxID=714159 RepID=A0ABU7LGQ1_9NOCA|nr:AraC family transcriptional regulator [Rhodococcus artemisiae]MEE2060737.1 AraC family transcriptional regulator [Rhodococcus artemisiae]